MQPPPLPTLAERRAAGRAARKAVPRSSLGEWAPPPARPDPVAVLSEQAAARVPELVPIRYGRMLASPFAFFRGGAAIMAGDLAPLPRTGLETQLSGDAHLANFGGFFSPDRRLVFDLNDFDETLPGPFEWDVRRLVASVEVAARHRGFGAATRRRACLGTARAYRDAMRAFAGSSTLDVWYARVDAEQVLGGRVDRARTNSVLALGRLTHEVDGRRRIAADPPLIVPIEDLLPAADAARLGDSLRDLALAYGRTLSHDRQLLLGRFRYVHAARKVVGVGSVGTRAWIVLLAGRDDRDALVLQVKEAQASVLEPFLGLSRFRHHGRRVVEGQRLMQSASDILLGWTGSEELDGTPRDYYVRQLRDGKLSARIDVMSPRTLAAYTELAGWTLARAHARAGDPVAIAAYLGSGGVFDRALAAFAACYADQSALDHAALREAVDSGRVEARTDLG